MSIRNKMRKKTKKRKQMGGVNPYNNITTGYYNIYGQPIQPQFNQKILGTLNRHPYNNKKYQYTQFTNILKEITETMDVEESFFNINESKPTQKPFFSYNAILKKNEKNYKLTIKYNSNKKSLFVEFKKIKNKPYYPQQGGFFWRRSKKFPKPKPIPNNIFDPSTYNKSKHNIEYSTINIDNDIKDLFDSIISFVGLDNNNYKCNKNKKQQCYIQSQTKTYKTKRYYKIYYYDNKKRIYEINIIIDKEQKYLRITTGKKGNWFLSKGSRTYKRSIKRN